jgi:phage terminase large subunit-like protein
MSLFPHGRYDDLTDSTMQAIVHLRNAGLAKSDEEAKAG